MQRRKWLIIVVAILILINFLYFLLPYFLDVNAYFGEILSEEIGKKVDAEITFSKIIFTTKFVRISDIIINHKNDEFNFSADQLYLEYNILSLLINHFNFSKAIKRARFFSPKISYNFLSDKKETSFQFDGIEKLLNRLSYISVINGEIHPKSENHNITFDTILDSVNLKLEKKLGKWKIDFSAKHSKDRGTINISGFYKKGKSNFDIEMNDFVFPQMEISQVKIKNGIANLNLPICDGKIEKGMLAIDSVVVDIRNQEFFVQEVNCKLEDTVLSFTQKSIIKWRSCEILVSGEILNYQSKKPEFNLEVCSKNVSLYDFSEKICGELAFTGMVSNSIYDPVIKLNLRSPASEILSQKIESFSTAAVLRTNKVDFLKGNFLFNGEQVSFSGNLALDTQNPETSKLNLTFASNKFQYPIKGINIGGKLFADVSGEIQNPELVCDFSDIEIAPQTLDLNHLKGAARLVDNSLSFAFKNSDETITFSGNGRNLFESQEIILNFQSQNLSLNNLFKEKFEWLDAFHHDLNSEIDISIDSERLSVNGLLDFQEQPFNQIVGKIYFEGEFPLIETDEKQMIQIYSDSLKLKNKEYKFDITAAADVDTVFISNISIDDAIIFDGKISRPGRSKLPDFYQGNLQISDLSLGKIINLVSLEQEEAEAFGTINGTIEFASKSKKPIFGDMQLNNFCISNIKPLDIYLSFGIEDSIFASEKVEVYSSDKNILAANFKIDLTGKNSLELYGKGENINIGKSVLSEPLQGIINYEIIGTGTFLEPNIFCNLDLRNGKIFGTEYDSCSIRFLQDNEVFNLNHFNISKEKEYNISALGAYGYNFFKKKFSDIPSEIVVNAEGDFLYQISQYLSDIKKAKSKSKLNLNLATEERRVIWKSGELIIKDGEMQIRNQPERFRKMDLQIEIANNQIIIKNCSMKIGDGRIFISNIFSEESWQEREDDSADIKIGKLNIGTILATTDKKGISIHIPKYMPERALGNFVLTGFSEGSASGKNDKYFRIFNDDGAWKLSGKIFASNGKVIYPPDKSKKAIEKASIFPPIKFDFNLILQKNVWYVSSPFHICAEQGDFINFYTNPENDKLSIYLDLHSHKGEMRLFGETFQVENVKVKKSKNDRLLKVDAVFHKKTPDGSMIYLQISSAGDKMGIGENIHTTKYGNFKITLHSDNPNDITMLSILSKLQYGKKISDLSEEERNDLYRDEALKLAGDELENLLFDSVLNPVESTIRQVLGLDFFRLKTGLIENIMRKGVSIFSEEDVSIEEEAKSSYEEISELSKEIILENLSVAMGKYITPNWYINYVASVRKELTAEQITKIGVQHEISFQYDLPLNLRVTYLHRFSPFREEENQRISLETVFRF